MPKPRTPTALKVLRGGKAPTSNRNGEPEPNLLNDLTPPSHLPERSAAVWREVAPMLRETKVLTVADVIALELLCDAVSDYRLARDRCGDNFVAISAKGSEMLSQWKVAKLSASKRAESLMSRFGMDPVSRSRVLIGGQGDLFGTGANPTDRFFK